MDVLELATLAIEAATLHISLAVRHAVLAGDMSFFLQLMLTMCKSAAVSVFALTCGHPELA